MRDKIITIIGALLWVGLWLYATIVFLLNI